MEKEFKEDIKKHKYNLWQIIAIICLITLFISSGIFIIYSKSFKATTFKILALSNTTIGLTHGDPTVKVVGEKMRDLAQKLLNIARNDSKKSTAYYWMAIAELKAGNYEVALTQINKSIEFDSYSTASYLVKAQIYEALDNNEEALILAKLCLEIARQKDLPIHAARCENELATIYWFLRDFSEARNHLKEAVRLYPEQIYYKKTLQALGDTGKNSSIDLSNNTSPAVLPLDRTAERIIKKSFGAYVTSKSSLDSLEKFTGYHAGVDFETFPEEQSIDVPVKAICEGHLLEIRNVSGYGGMVVQECVIDNEGFTVVYGQLRLSSIKAKVNDELKAGENFAVLGTGFSSETDGERKHLHLSIHVGGVINIAHYLQDEKDIYSWRDPILVLGLQKNSQ